MGGFGWHNPFPVEVGGGETAVERIYAALRSAAGKGGSADDEDSIDGLLRQCTARAIASVATFGERSALQAFPNHATDALPYYERLFLLAQDPELSDDQRRQAAALRYTNQGGGALPDVEAALQRIDARFSLVATDPADSDVTIHGRAFDDLDGAEPYDPGGTRHSTAYPNYSTELVCFVLFELGAGVLPTADEDRALLAAQALLSDMLPSDNDYSIATSGDGFELDVDRLDLTSFGA